MEACRLFLDYFEIGGAQHRGEARETWEFGHRAIWACAQWALLFGTESSIT